MIRIGHNSSLPVLNGSGAVTRVVQILPEQVLRIRIVGLQRHHFLQKLGCSLRLVFLLCRESEEIECACMSRAVCDCGFQFPARVLIFASLVEESAQVVVSRSQDRDPVGRPRKTP